MDLVAFTHGANVLEKTITENKMTKSVEHIMSLEFAEMKKFVNAVRKAEKAFGLYDRKLSIKDIKKRNLLRRSAFFTKNIVKILCYQTVKLLSKDQALEFSQMSLKKLKI